MGSRGSVIPFFMSVQNNGEFPITDFGMTRFMITLEEGVELVWKVMDDMVGGEIYVKKIPSMKITDIARAVNPNNVLKEVGIRPGEKLHEEMISAEDAAYTYEYDDFYKILPSIHKWYEDSNRIGSGKHVNKDFVYNSKNNPDWMSVLQLKNWIKSNLAIIGKL